ncbi:unnamed protein product, partial [Prorocentrum cordatum]
ALGRWTLDSAEGSGKETDRKGPNGSVRVLIGVEDFVLSYDQSRTANKLEMWGKDVARPTEERLQRYEGELEDVDTWSSSLHANTMGSAAADSILRGGRSRPPTPPVPDQDPSGRSDCRGRSRSRSDVRSRYQPSPPASTIGDDRSYRGKDKSGGKRKRKAKGKSFADIAATTFAKFQRKLSKMGGDWAAMIDQSSQIMKDAMPEMASAGVALLVQNLVYKGTVCQAVFSEAGKRIFYPSLGEVMGASESQGMADLTELTARRFDADAGKAEQIK